MILPWHVRWGATDDEVHRSLPGDDIREQQTYPFQNLWGRIITAVIARRIIKRNVLENKDGRMKAVYENLTARGLIKPAGQPQPQRYEQSSASG